jgi:Flp pilus assembly protein TadB
MTSALIAALMIGMTVAQIVLRNMQRGDARRRATAVVGLRDAGSCGHRSQLARLRGRFAISVFPQWRAQRATVLRTRALQRTLSEFVDVLALALRSGMTSINAIEACEPWAPLPWRGFCGAINVSFARGATLAQALAQQVAAAPTAAALAAALVAAENGAPVSETLDRLASEVRADDRRRSEQRARALSVQLLFPLVFLVLPAFVLIAIAPALLSGINRIAPAIP